MTTINTGYIPREPQRLIHKSVKDNRFTVVVAHRRMGKTVGAINQLIHSALNCQLKNPRFALITATYSQAKSCLLYTSPSPRDRTRSRMPSSA